MGKMNSMLATAGLLLAAHQNTPAQGTDTAAERTKATVHELINVLDPSKYGAARGVLA